MYKEFFSKYINFAFFLPFISFHRVSEIPIAQVAKKFDWKLKILKNGREVHFFDISTGSERP